MAFNAFLQFTQYGTSASKAGAVVKSGHDSGLESDGGTYFPISDYSFDVEQTLNIGSQASGAGAGRITFNPLGVTRKSDAFSPTLFAMSCSGTPFAFGVLLIYADRTLLQKFTFKLCAVKTMAFSTLDGQPVESVSFEYGGLVAAIGDPTPSGHSTVVTKGWNKVRNVRDDSPTTVIA